MTDQGFDYPTSDEAADDPRWAGGDGEPSVEEIEVAMADVACKAKASVVETWRDAEATAQQGLIEEHPEDFALFAQVKEDNLERARTVIERSGS